MSAMNPLGLNSQQAAGMIGGVSSPAIPEEAPMPVESPAESELKKVAMQFSSTWKVLEQMNTEYGGDAEKFRAMLKAAENWFADIASKTQDAAPSQTPTY